MKRRIEKLEVRHNHEPAAGTPGSKDRLAERLSKLHAAGEHDQVTRVMSAARHLTMQRGRG